MVPPSKAIHIDDAAGMTNLSVQASSGFARVSGQVPGRYPL